MIIQKYLCDNCGKELSESVRFFIDLGEEFNGVDYDKKEEEIHFCSYCAGKEMQKLYDGLLLEDRQIIFAEIQTNRRKLGYES